MLEWCQSSLEHVEVCWNGVGVEWWVLEWLGMVLEWCWSGFKWLGIVLEGVRGCWSGLGAAWKVLECVGMVLEWIGGCWSSCTVVKVSGRHHH